MRWSRWLTAAAAATAAVVVVGRRRRRAGGDTVPRTELERETLVDEASAESFPASDPPSYWGRSAEDG